MKDIFKVSLFFVFSFLFVFTVSAQTKSGVTSPVEVEFEPLSKSCVIGEPVYLQFSIRNTTSREVEVRSRMTMNGDLKIKIVMPNSLPLEYLGVFERGFPPHYVFKIPGGKTEYLTYTLLYERESDSGLLFDKVMTARVFISLEYMIGDERKEEKFPPFDVEVNKPADEQMKALSMLLDDEVIKQIHKQRCKPETRPLLKQFLVKYPATPYSPPVLFALANSYLVPDEDGSPDYETAIELFKDFIRHFPSHILADDAVYKIGDCYDRLGEEEKARQWLVNLYNNYLESNRVNYQDELIERYIFSKDDVKIPPGFWMLFPVGRH